MSNDLSLGVKKCYYVFHSLYVTDNNIFILKEKNTSGKQNSYYNEKEGSQLFVLVFVEHIYQDS